MKLLLKNHKAKLLANHLATRDADGADLKHKPVVKFFGGGACTWLITEMDEDGYMFGLCDLGFGTPEMGYVDFAELAALRFPPFGLGIERDMHWTADKTLTEYADEARGLGRIAA